MRLDGGRVDLDGGFIERADGRKKLSPMERALLSYLGANPGRVLPKEELLREVWGYREGVVSRTVYTTIDRLRQKIETDARKPRHLLAIRGVGYRFVPPLAPAEQLRGRDAEVRTLLDTAGAVAIVGPGGSGKTRLVREVLEPEDLWIDVPDGIDRAGLIHRVGQALGVRVAAEDALRRHEGRVIFDDADLASEDAQALLGEWAAEGLRVWITARSGFGAIPQLAVGPIDAEAALGLLAAQTEQEVPEELVRHLQGWPLALTLAGSMLRTLPADLLVELIRTHGPLKMLVTPRDSTRHGSLAAMLRASWDRLDTPVQEAIALLAAVRAPLGVDLAERLVGERLEGILSASLADLDEQGRVRLLLGVDDLALQACPVSFEGVHAVLLEELERDRASFERDAFVVSERGALEAAFEVAAPDDAARLAEGVVRFYELRGPYAAMVEVLDRALERNPSPRHIFSLRVRRAGCLRQCGRLVESEAEAREVLADPPLEPSSMARAACALGATLMTLGRMEESLEVFQASLGDSRMGARAARRLGLVLCYLHRPLEAIPHLEEALRRDRDNGERISEGIALNSLAMAWTDLGDLDRAYEYYAASAEVSRSVGAELRAASVDCNLAIHLALSGRSAEARPLFDEALPILLEGGELRLYGLARGNRGFLHLQDGDTAQAEACYQEALEVAQAIGDPRGEALALAGLGHVRMVQGDEADAEELMGRGLEAMRAQGELRLGLFTLTRLAILRGDSAEVAEALEPVADRLWPEVAVALAVLGRQDEARALAERLGVRPDSLMGRWIWDVYEP